jgi:hypothetical protein
MSRSSACTDSPKMPLTAAPGLLIGIRYKGQIKIHHKYTVLQTNPILPLTSSAATLSPAPPLPTHSLLSFPRSASILPKASLQLPLPASMCNIEMVSIQPSHTQPHSIPPQICPVLLNNTVITNPSEDIWLVKKKSTFLAVPSKTIDPIISDSGCTNLPSQPRLLPPPRSSRHTLSVRRYETRKTVDHGHH